MLTNTQQQTIQFLTEQFEKLNASTQPKTKFNLVDIKPLEDKAERIRQLDEEEKITKKMWIDAQENESKRIYELLREDLPNKIIIVTNCYGGMKICREEFINKKYDEIEFDDCVRIAVCIDSEDVYDKYSEKKRKIYNNLYYILNNSHIGNKFSTIEELVSTDEFKDTLRKRVL